MGLFLVAPPGSDAQTPRSDDEAYGDLIPGGAEAIAGYNEFRPDNSGAPLRRTSRNIRCSFYKAGGEGESDGELSGEALLSEYESAVANGRDSVLVYRVCIDLDTGEVVTSVDEDDEGDGFPWSPGNNGEVIDPAVLRDIARSQLEYPPPVGDMAPGLETGTFAQLPSYYWVTNTDPQPGATAAAGPVWARVWAEAIRQEWVVHDDLRGNHTFSCDGPGVPYTPADGGEPPAGACPPWEPPHSSAGQSTTHPDTGEPCFEATVTLTWAVAWESNAAAGGPLGTGQSAATTCIVVHEIQAVVTDG